MIPKIIHWCFLSDPYPEMVEKCLQNWKKFCPDYTIKRWDMTNINFDELPRWCKVAYDNKLYAFVADYIRVKAIYEEGGVYLDSDVYCCASDPFKDYENDKLWIPMEKVFKPYNIKYMGCDYCHGIGANPVFFGAESGHEFLHKLLERYQEFPDDYPIIASREINKAPIAPCVWSSVLENTGFKYENVEQHLPYGIHILTNEKFNHTSFSLDTKKMKAIHFARNSWRR